MDKGDKLEVLVGIDPGAECSGVAWIVPGCMPEGANLTNGEVFSFIKGLGDLPGVRVVIEDLRAYQGVMRGAVINTAKWCGQWEFRLERAGFVSGVHLVARNTVKAWAFDKWPLICHPRIEGKIGRLGPIVVQGKGDRLRKVSFHYVDDRIVIACMKECYGIPTPLPGKSNGLGLVGHAWQALAVLSCWLAKNKCA